MFQQIFDEIFREMSKVFGNADKFSLKAMTVIAQNTI